jgi:hypothetical protein
MILQAASRVNYLPLRGRLQVNLAYGVWSSLVDRGFLRTIPTGWEITPEGREIIAKKETNHDIKLSRTARRKDVAGREPADEPVPQRNGGEAVNSQGRKSTRP